MDVESNGVDFWDQSYYWFTKTVFRAVGHWPYQSRREALICRTIQFFTYWVQVIPQISAIAKHYDDFDLIIELMSSFGADTVVIANLCTYMLNSDKIRSLLDQIKQDWKIFPMNNGLENLRYHTEIGRQRAMLYSGSLYAACLVFVSEPLHDKLFRIFIPSNKSLSHGFAIPVDYGPLDTDKYYYILVAISAISIIGIVTVVISGDILLFLYAQHACGLFAALGFAIENLPVDEYSRNQTSDYEYQYMKKCVIVHHRILEFANAIEEMFCWNFFVLVGLNMLVISMTAVQVVINSDSIDRLFKVLVYVFASIAHLFIQCFMSQQLLNSSLGVQQSLMNSKWYLSTKQTKQLLQFMVMRTQISVHLTAGKMVLMSLNTFSAIIRTSATYFTVFLDIH